MHDVRRVEVVEKIMEENDRIACEVKEKMREKRVLVVNEMGAPGVGKTTTIKNTLERIRKIDQEIGPMVIEGDIESDIDTQALRKIGIQTYQINTFGSCHLDSPMVEHALEHMEADENGILFIENIGNLVCPAEFSIGEHVKMLISSVTEGSDKPYKYPLAFEKADVIVLNKVDLIPYVDFDEEFFLKGIRALNRNVPVFKVSGRRGEGFDELAQWLVDRQREL